jgi:hypothetical protein
MAERELTANDLERILKIYLRIVQELPPETPAGKLDEHGHLQFSSDIGAKLRAARAALGDLDRIRRSGDT